MATYALRPKADYDQVCAAIAISKADKDARFIYTTGKYPVLTRIMREKLPVAAENVTPDVTIGYTLEGVAAVDNHVAGKPCCQIIADEHVDDVSIFEGSAIWLLAGIWAETAHYKGGNKPVVAEKLEEYVRQNYDLGNTENVYHYIDTLFAFNDEEKAKIAAATAACNANDTTANGIRVIRSYSDADWTPASTISAKEPFVHCHTLLIFMNDKLSFRGNSSEESKKVRLAFDSVYGESGKNPAMGSWTRPFDAEEVEKAVRVAYSVLL